MHAGRDGEKDRAGDRGRERKILRKESGRKEGRDGDIFKELAPVIVEP